MKTIDYQLIKQKINTKVNPRKDRQSTHQTDHKLKLAINSTKKNPNNPKLNNLLRNLANHTKEM
jgi:hypothetical protein